MLVPTKTSPEQHGTEEMGNELDDVGHHRAKSVMEDLVDQLAALDRATSGPESDLG